MSLKRPIDPRHAVATLQLRVIPSTDAPAPTPVAPGQKRIWEFNPIIPPNRAALPTIVGAIAITATTASTTTIGATANLKPVRRRLRRATPQQPSAGPQSIPNTTKTATSGQQRAAPRFATKAPPSGFPGAKLQFRDRI